jgi:cyclophilin family peptidyl-prolyl cis-trans isomerase/HEAT repeat protein
MTRALSLLGLFLLAQTSKPAPRMDTPLVICGSDQTLAGAIPLGREAIALAADSRGFMPCPAGPHGPNHREQRERALLASAAASRDPELRRRAAMAYGQMAWPSAVAVMKNGAASNGPLIMLLGDAGPRVRRQAAVAIGDALAGQPEPRNEGYVPASGGELIHARAALESRLPLETDDEAAGAILETIGRLRYPDDSQRETAEKILVSSAAGGGARALGAVKGLEALIRMSPKRPVGMAARERLRELAASGSTPRVRRLALGALQAARDDHDQTLALAAQDADWQVRRLVALRLDMTRDAHQPIGIRLSQDPVFQVRYEMVAVLVRYAATSQQCKPVVAMMQDAELTVAMRAMDLVPESCPDRSEIVQELVFAAGSLAREESHVRWHRPARAYSALARLSPDVAKGLSQAAAKHPAWQVRAAVAAVSAAVKDAARLEQLAGDDHPNVRTAAIDGLRRLGSPAAARAAILALESDDYQLLRSAAAALRGVPAGDREAAIEALLVALRRVSARLTDTSRDPRVAILERLEELLPADRVKEVASFTGDFDRAVREVASRIVAAKTGRKAVPEDLRERYPYQPSRADLASLPATATLQMEGGGTIVLELLGSEAPVTVARFAQLARAGYYDGLTFHRVVPNFVIQGLSPGANEYVGAPRYMRDEAGTVPHLRGAVGISTRGRDTGDGQIFIDLVDLPRLDHDYTVFARVTSGMEVADRILEGATVRRVTVK